MGEVNLIPGKKHAPRHLGRVLVLGLGKSGRAVVEYLAHVAGERVESISVAAGAQTPEATALACELTAQTGARVLFNCERIEGSYDLSIASPGIPEGSSLYQSAAAASTELIGEVEFAWRESAAESRWIAITGTNGKTTVTALVAQALCHAGMNAKAVGNIGDTCLAAVEAGETEVYVAEVSSYQLASTVNFAPNVAVLLNITPDHLHWHGSLEAYRDAKFKVFANLSTGSGAVAVLDATNDIVRAEVRRLKVLTPEERGFAYVPLGTAAGWDGDMRAACGSENAAFIDAEGMLCVALNGREYAVLCADDLRIKGIHNASNALAAATAALALGADAARVAEGLRTFEPLEHRIEPCGSVRDIACYNDSKATNVDATLKALVAFPHTRPLVLLGGDDKGTDLAPLVVAAHAYTRVCVCFGAAGSRFAEAFEATASDAPDDFILLRADHLEDALDAALAAAYPGEVVLLSPACASFDEFGSFEERGNAFKSLVAVRGE